MKKSIEVCEICRKEKCSGRIFKTPALWRHHDKGAIMCESDPCIVLRGKGFFYDANGDCSQSESHSTTICSVIEFGSVKEAEDAPEATEYISSVVCAPSRYKIIRGESISEKVAIPELEEVAG